MYDIEMFRYKSVNPADRSILSWRCSLLTYHFDLLFTGTSASAAESKCCRSSFSVSTGT